jgi:hypothetical protein
LRQEVDIGLVGIVEQVAFRMRVRVDKSRQDGLAGRIDHQFRLRIRGRIHRNDALAGYPDTGGARRRLRPVVHGAIDN